MQIDYHLLAPATLRAVIEEFVLRDGTDYGEREASLDTKCAHVVRQLEAKEVELVFDAETESCDLRVVGAAAPAVKSPSHPSR